MCHTTNPLATQPQSPLELASSGFIESTGASFTENSSQAKAHPTRVRSVTSFLTHGVFAAALLGLITIVTSNTLQMAHALATDSEDLHGQGMSPESLLKARRILSEDLLMKDFSRCTECVQYPDLKTSLAKSARIAESYVMMQVAKATQIHFDGTEDAQIVTMENFVEKTAKIPELKEKTEELLRLNKTFEVSLKNAIEFERKVQDLRYRAEVKARSIEDYSKKAVKNVQESGEVTRKIDRISKQLQDSDDDYVRKINALKAEKNLIQNKIDKMAGELKNNLDEAGVASAPMLSDTIAFKASLIDAQKKVVESCEEKIASHTEEITNLNIKHTTAHRALGDIELQLSQWHWVKHVLETIKKFEDIRDQIRELQKSQLADGKTNVDRLIRSLTTNEAQFAIDKWNFIEGKGTGTVEKRTVTDEYGRTVITETVSNSGLSNLENQQTYIEQEQRYLRTWSREQFKTLNLSTHEIRNLTETIDNLYERIENAGEYNKYVDLKSVTEKDIELIITKIGELEKEMDSCKNVVADNAKTIDESQRELSRLEKLRSAIRDLESQMAAQEAKLQAKDTALRKEKQDLIYKRSTLTEDLAQLNKKLADLRDQLKGLVKTINERIMDNPRLDAVNKEIAEYRVKVRKSNDEYQRLVSLMEDIRRIIC